MQYDELNARLDRLESRLSGFHAELEEVRRLLQAQARAAPAAAAPPRPVGVVPGEAAGARGAPTVGIATGSLLPAPGRALERDRPDAALRAAFREFRRARAAGDAAVLDEVGALARTAALLPRADVRRRAEVLVLRVDAAREALRGEAATRRPSPRRPAPAAPVPPPLGAAPTRAPAAGPAPSPAPARARTFAERAGARLRGELTGARAFAIGGGVVTLLGIIFLFVLAADRGWIGPRERVALGAVASGALLIAGIALRVRYGRVVAAVAAVGAGLAGAYATLAAAAILYGFLPTWGALLVAAAIASVGAAVALAWSSQILAGLALVGAALAPAALALDNGIDWLGTAFALVVLCATIAVASRLRWLWLDVGVGGVAVAQVAWLTATAPPDTAGPLAVTCLASLVLLAGAVAWQAGGGRELDAASAGFALTAAGVGLAGPIRLVSDDIAIGAMLLALGAVFGLTALGSHRRFSDLSWTIGAGALLLAAVATAFLVSGRSLTVVWGVEAAVLMALAWRLGAPRFQLASFGYLGAAAGHCLAVEILPKWPDSGFDVPGAAAAGLLAVAASSLAAGVLQPSERRDAPSLGVFSALDPLWDALVRNRLALRALLAAGGATALGAAFAALLSGRPLTIALSALAAGLGVAAFGLAEHRLQPFAFGVLGYALVHALAVEAPPSTLTFPRGGTAGVVDPSAPVPSLIALAVASAVLAGLTRFGQRGIPRLGPLGGPELRLAALERHAPAVRRAFALVAASAAVWAVGLLAIDASYELGQVVATALWALLGALVVALGARVASVSLQCVGFGYATFALLKSSFFDWDRLGDGAAAASLLIAAAAILLAGFTARWLARAARPPVEALSLATGALAAVVGIVALGRVFDLDSRTLGFASLSVTAALACVGLAPYVRWRRGDEASWLRTLANGYWALSLATLLFAESVIVLGAAAGTLALWAGTGAALVVAARPLAEARVWLAGLAVTTMSAVGTLALLTPPRSLVRASAHPATDLWVLAVVIVAAWLTAHTAPGWRLSALRRRPALSQRWWLLGGAAGLTLYGASLGVLELAELVSDASVTTDFQRGHTVLSALWGIGALVLYVTGLARERRDMRILGLLLFGLALAKLFLYDLSTLSSITRALSFLAVGTILLAAGFFVERLVGHGGGGPHTGARHRFGT